MNSIKAYGAQSATSPIAPLDITRRDPGANDVEIEIMYCGVCHSDIHQARDEWGGSLYPIVPGHEIIGRVARVGADVKKFAVGDIAGVGCMVDSCRNCDNCEAGLEQYCLGTVSWTYNSPDGRSEGQPTFGGYSKKIVTDEAFVLKVPDTLDLKSAAPLLCAGITTWSPLRHWKVGPGTRMGVVGLGGLGHMAVKFGHAFGASVTLFTTSPGKTEDARRLGADDVVVSKDAEAMAAHAGQYDFIIDTVSASHPMERYLGLLRLDGVIVLVGIPTEPMQANAFSLAGQRRSIAGSAIGGIRETQEMLDYCGEHGITSDVEMISIQEINTAYERMIKGDVKYRFVIDMASLQ